MDYVAGFCFSKCGEWVALIRKLNPEWQRGLLNGIGGKVEPGESPQAAVVREFEQDRHARRSDEVIFDPAMADWETIPLTHHGSRSVFSKHPRHRFTHGLYDTTKRRHRRADTPMLQPAKVRGTYLGESSDFSLKHARLRSSIFI